MHLNSQTQRINQKHTNSFNILILDPFLFSGSGEFDTDKKKIVELSIYPNTGFNEYLFSDDMYGEFLQYSEGKNTSKQLLLSPGESFASFNYQKGYHYTIKAEKINIKHSPKQASSVIYQYLETLSKEKIITQDAAEDLIMDVAPVKINFIPRGKEPRKAYLVKLTTESKPRPILKIKEFHFKKGYHYRLRVRKTIQASPFKEHYTLLEVMSKNK